MSRPPNGTNDVNRERAAFLEAQGVSSRVITRQLDISSSTMRDWRTRPDYQADVEKWRSGELERLGDQITTLKLEVLEIVRDAIPKLREALEATDEDGSPLWRVRMEALRILFDKVKVEESKKEGEGATANAAVIIVNRPGVTTDVIEGGTIDG